MVILGVRVFFMSEAPLYVLQVLFSQEEFAPFAEGELYPSNMATNTGPGSGGRVELFQATPHPTP